MVGLFPAICISTKPVQNLMEQRIGAPLGPAAVFLCVCVVVIGSSFRRIQFSGSFCIAGYKITEMKLEKQQFSCLVKNERFIPLKSCEEVYILHLESF